MMKWTAPAMLWIVAYGTIGAQCTTLDESGRKEEGLDAYSIYVDAMDQGDYALAYENWKLAYEIAPAYDGVKPYNFTSGIEILTKLFEQEQDPAKKEEWKQRILQVFDDYYRCYASKKMRLESGCTTDSCYRIKLGQILGDKAFHMFYYLRTPYSKLKKVLDEAVDKAGVHSLYTVIIPYATVAVYLFDKGKISAEEARRIHQRIREIAEYNIAKKDEWAEYYDQSLKHAEAKFGEIELKLYDCDYFEKKFRPEYEADTNNMERVKYMIAKMKKAGCDEQGNAFLSRLERRWERYATTENLKLRAEFEAKNPHIAAKRLFDEGVQAQEEGKTQEAKAKFREAIEKYRLAIDKAESDEDKARYHFAIASILFRKLKQHVDARREALRAAALKKGWGRPYMLIGDMYASTARHCGDLWNQRLAILAAIDKYAYAKSIDPEVREEANRKIARYAKLRPPKEEGFMRKIKEGQKVKVNCWIGETVIVRYN